MSTDPAGVAYHPPSGHLYIADSEINEFDPPIWTGPGNNIFEVSDSGNVLFREITSGNNEPTGITYNEADGYFYVTNDDAKTITRYDISFNVDTTIFTTADIFSATDPEGITSDPSTGNLYVADAAQGGRQVLIYDSDLTYIGGFSLDAVIPGIDPEGIAFEPGNDHLFILWRQAYTIYQFTTSGTLLQSYDYSGFSPLPDRAQGLTFAPTSDSNDDPENLALYIADAMVDNDLDPNERDGRIYEAIITIADFVGTPRIIATGSEVAFTNLSPTDITSYFWDFGDGGTSTERDPSHTYNATGVYSVSLTVTGPLGTHMETKTDYIRVVEGLSVFQDGVNGYAGTWDTWLDSSNQSTIYGSDPTLQVDGRDPDQSALLRWDLFNIPLGSIIYSVDITVNVTNTSNATYEIYDLKQPWVEDEATWNAYASGQNWEVAGADGSADRGYTAFGAIVGSSLGSITTSLNAAGVAAVQSWVDDPSSNHGFIVQDYINHSNRLAFSSREATAVTDRPKLTVVYTPPYVLVEVKILLQGPYDASGDTMRTGLRDHDFIPSASPYLEDPRTTSSPIPLDITDWVLVELRETDTSPAVASKSAFLRKDGRIVADDGTTEQIMIDVPEGYYYMVVQHRNHLAVMSTGSVQLSSGFSTLYDFTTGTGKYYGSDAKELEPGIYGMYTGDANSNDQVQNDDKNDYWKLQVGSAGYKGADLNLNGQVQNDDKNDFWKENVGKGTRVP